MYMAPVDVEEDDCSIPELSESDIEWEEVVDGGGCTYNICQKQGIRVSNEHYYDIPPFLTSYPEGSHRAVVFTTNKSKRCTEEEVELYIDYKKLCEQAPAIQQLLELEDKVNIHSIDNGNTNNNNSNIVKTKIDCYSEPFAFILELIANPFQMLERLDSLYILFGTPFAKDVLSYCSKYELKSVSKALDLAFSSQREVFALDDATLVLLQDNDMYLTIEKSIPAILQSLSRTLYRGADQKEKLEYANRYQILSRKTMQLLLEELLRKPGERKVYYRGKKY